MKGEIEQVVRQGSTVVLTVRVLKPYFEADISHITTEEEREEYDKAKHQYEKEIREFERLRLGKIGFGYCD